MKRLVDNLLHRRRAEDTLHAELGAYLDDMTSRNIANGMQSDEARHRASLELGGFEQIKEEVRDVWLGQGIHTALQDVCHASRSLARSPAFTIIVIATLAVGIAAGQSHDFQSHACGTLAPAALSGAK